MPRLLRFRVAAILGPLILRNVLAGDEGAYRNAEYCAAFCSAFRAASVCCTWPERRGVFVVVRVSSVILRTNDEYGKKPKRRLYFREIRSMRVGLDTLL